MQQITKRLAADTRLVSGIILVVEKTHCNDNTSQNAVGEFLCELKECQGAILAQLLLFVLPSSRLLTEE